MDTTSDYYAYDGSLKFYNSTRSAVVPNTVLSRRTQGGLWQLSTSVMSAGTYYINIESDWTQHGRLDNEWFIEKIN